jgi:hypothetical protein
VHPLPETAVAEDVGGLSHPAFPAKGGFNGRDESANVSAASHLERRITPTEIDPRTITTFKGSAPIEDLSVPGKRFPFSMLDEDGGEARLIRRVLGVVDALGSGARTAAETVFRMAGRTCVSW